MTGVLLQAPPELRSPISSLLPQLAERGVQRLEVFSYNRPGEPAFWLGFIFTSSGRHGVGTPDLRHLPLSEQIHELLVQLERWTLPSRTGDH